MITAIELLSQSECESLVSTVHDLRERWILRGVDPCRFFTLGAASYIDDSAQLRRFAAVYNPLLLERFGTLLGLVRSVLARQLLSPARFDDNFAVPGFHIWQVPSIFTTPVASTHFDIQYQHLPWPPGCTPDFDRPISFTLPLRLPRRGGGLNWWNITYKQYSAICERADRWLDVRDVAASEATLYQPYTPGVLVLHSGHLLHQIAPVAQVNPDDERITLQGHGVNCNGEWVLYW